MLLQLLDLIFTLSILICIEVSLNGNLFAESLKFIHQINGLIKNTEVDFVKHQAEEPFSYLQLCNLFGFQDAVYIKHHVLLLIAFCNKNWP